MKGALGMKHISLSLSEEAPLRASGGGVPSLGTLEVLLRKDPDTTSLSP